MSGTWPGGAEVTLWRSPTPAHPEAICVLTTTEAVNEPHTWLLVDDTCAMWRSTEWVEARSPELLVHRAIGQADQ